MMVKKILFAAGLMAIGSMSVVAGDIVIEDNLADGSFSYIGKADGTNRGEGIDSLGGDKYDIYSMIVSRSDDGIMTVTINTNFVEYNTKNNLYFGDLFMSTTGWNPTGDASDGYQDDNAYTTGTKWDYVYDLNNARKMKGNGDDDYSATNTSSARLRELKDYDMSDPHDADNFKYGSSRWTDRGGDQLYLAKNSAFGATFNSGQQYDVSININDNQSYLQFVFDVNGTSLNTANQIAFRWTMSCANDIIEGVANFAGKVPEPAALGLMLLGLGGLVVARRRKKQG
ncbi:hypothetical protein MNBD_ALPHA01-469 [hydrothermal vent metagenome]|uniref:Ice-binding protein C-terminal domain-containing protein n=1 Tax=hydrothermal vent metagenome TaxID=652676 RepID=A0A3B0RMP9_9ZZZZ